MYLGCNILKHDVCLSDGVVARAVVYDMESFPEQCLARYVVAAGGDVKFKETRVAFRPDDPQNKSPLCNPSGNAGDVCPWCQSAKDEKTLKTLTGLE